jgi:hypothetical protein
LFSVCGLRAVETVAETLKTGKFLKKTEFQGITRLKKDYTTRS